MSEALCVVDRCRGDKKPRPAVGQAYLCHICWQRMEHSIAELPNLHDELQQWLQPGTGGSDPVSRKGHDPNLQLNFAVADLRNRIPGVLASWARLVSEDRGVHAPAGINPPSLAAFLTTHVGWLAHQPFGNEAAQEFRELHGRARAMAYPDGRRSFPIGECVFGDCLGVLHATLAEPGDNSHITCDHNDEHTWPEHRWLFLGRWIHRMAA